MNKKVNILAIDDEPEIIYTFKAVAELENWNVDGINDPQKAIEIAQKNSYDIILLDYHMPVLNGLSLLKKLRNSGIHIPIIILTIDERYTIAQKFLNAGADDYALKPIKAADLISRIKAHLKSNIIESEISKLEDLILPKGLSSQTLERIYKIIEKQNEFLTIEEISNLTNFAYQTTHRYLDFLEKEDYVVAKLQYGKIGRPTKRYKTKE